MTMTPGSRVVTVALLFSAVIANAQDAAPHTAVPASAGYVEREFWMPVPGAGQGLDVVEVYISAPGKHPLALLTHGTSSDRDERMQVTPWAMLPQAIWF